MKPDPMEELVGRLDLLACRPYLTDAEADDVALAAQALRQKASAPSREDEVNSPAVARASGDGSLPVPSAAQSGTGGERRHYAKRAVTGDMHIIDRQSGFVRCIMPYDYAYTSNSQQWDEASRICQALEGPMSALGIARIYPEQGPASHDDGASMRHTLSATVDPILPSPTEARG